MTAIPAPQSRQVSGRVLPPARLLEAGGDNPAPSLPAAPLAHLSMPELAAIIRADDAWPEDPHKVPRWRLAQEERARRIGYELPPYRTRAEYEASVHAVTQRLALLSIPSADGARRFVAWCLEQSDISRFASAELDAAYGRYCKAAGLIPHAPGPFRAALKKIPGVEVAHAEKDRNGRRHRPTIWTIRLPAPITRMAA